MSVEDAALPPPTAVVLRALDAALGAGEPPVAALECMCAWCRRVLGADGRWERVEVFVEKRAGIEFTHGICKTCLESQRRLAIAGGRPLARRSPRVPLELPVRLYRQASYWSARTAVVNRQGALVLSPVALPEKEMLRVTGPEAGQSAMCRVVWCGGEERPGLHKLGVEFVDAPPAFWGDAYDLGPLGGPSQRRLR